MAKQRFPEAEARLFKRIFICMSCGARLRTDLPKIREGKVKCRKCHKKNLRPIHKEHKT
jgi:ribosomal protein L40E